ncbi:T9SS type A sorting domain-containing protein [candidate division KSB1 bacterium]|nr:T9SS type A sorting domain-containing protein [candidate division KSB1 bacterium]
MKRRPMFVWYKQSLFLLLSCILFVVQTSLSQAADTIAYRLKVARNDAVVGGELHLDLQLRISEGVSPRTLHSLTFDVPYSSDLAPCDDDMATGWMFGTSEGYRTVVSKLEGYYRVLAAGQSVNEQGSGVPAGWFLTNTWQTVVRLKWIIQNVAPLNLQVNQATDCSAYFVNISNNPPNLAESYALTDEGLYQPPLAVQLSLFTLNSLNQSIAIRWTTESEKDNLGFNIHRSFVEKGPYDIINTALIEGGGNSQEPQRYEYIDEDVIHNQWYYYKLEQIDRNGGGQMFGPIKIYHQDHAIPDRFYVQQNFPNPFNDETSIEFGLPEQVRVELTLVNMRGEMIREWPQRTMAAGRHRILWDGRSRSGLQASSGVYFFRIKTDEDQGLVKLIKLR